MDYYILEFEYNNDINGYYEELTKELTKVFNDNMIYINSCSFFLGLFLISTITGICICNFINPNQNYILIEQKDNRKLNKKMLAENNV